MSYVTTRIGADPRRHDRHYVNLRSSLTRGEMELTVWTVDLSGGGARLGLDLTGIGEFDGEGWELSVPGIGSFPVHRKWLRGSTCGVRLLIDEGAQAKLSEDLGRMFPGR